MDDARMLLTEREAGAGAMPPLHARDRDETYHVVRGSMTFFVGDDVLHAQEGELVVVPRGKPRTFRVESERARWLVLTRARSALRYEDFGRALAVPSGGAVWSTPDDAAAVTAIAQANEIAILGPPGMLPSDL